jgi:cobalt-zinc-cadmium efflux system protein
MHLLTAGNDASSNVKGAYREVWADMIGSIGVIMGAAVVIRFTGWTWIDPIVAIAMGLGVLPRPSVLFEDTTNALLEGVPGGLCADARTAAVIRIALPSIPWIMEWSLRIWVLPDRAITGFRGRLAR